MKGGIPAIDELILRAFLAVGLLVSGVLFLPPISAAAATTTGAANEEAVLAAEMARACEAQRASFGEHWGERADLDGDGQIDLILDHGGILCDGLRGNLTCGFRACDVLIYLQRQGRLVKVYEILSIGYELSGGPPPSIKLVGHEFDEGAIRWDGQRFADMAAASSMAPQVGVAGASTRWRYGQHPLLGLTAHVDSGDLAIGLACGQAHYDRPRSESVEIRVSPSLVRPPSTVIAFQSGHAVGASFVDSGRGYHSVKNDVCMAGIADFRSQDVMMVLPAGKINSITADGAVSKIEYMLSDGTSVALEGPGGMDRVPGTVHLPLSGSSTAIGKLIAACPAMRADIDNNCGI